MNPLDVAITNDHFPFRRLQPPCVAGWEAIVQLDDGTRRYLADPPAPYGMLADLGPVPGAAAFPVQPRLAAALRVAGMADWVALDYRGHLQPAAAHPWAPDGLAPCAHTSGRPAVQEHVMSLSHHQQHQLHRIETGLLRADPQPSWPPPARTRAPSVPAAAGEPTAAQTRPVRADR